jgi:regulator of cell morphogenesis and NO signaling
MTATPDTTIRDLVTADFRAAAVFDRHGIDFCCGGDRTVGDACQAKGLRPLAVLSEVAQACSAADPVSPELSTQEPRALIGRIITKHHAYVREALPIIVARTRKVALVHGENHPELHEVERLFQGVSVEMIAHMEKEEVILFPFITELAAAGSVRERAPVSPFGTVANPIHMMEDEHERAGWAMARIRELTGGYQPPTDACATYRIALQELEAFEQDLHAHVHLENNILFPEALRLEADLR